MYIVYNTVYSDDDARGARKKSCPLEIPISRAFSDPSQSPSRPSLSHSLYIYIFFAVFPIYSRYVTTISSHVLYLRCIPVHIHNNNIYLALAVLYTFSKIYIIISKKFQYFTQLLYISWIICLAAFCNEQKSRV